MMSSDNKRLVTLFMRAQEQAEGYTFSENVLAGLKAVLKAAEVRCPNCGYEFDCETHSLPQEEPK